MDCKALAKKIEELKSQLSSLNATAEAIKRDIPAGNLEEMIEKISKETGYSKEDLQYVFERSESNKESMSELGEHADKVDAEAQATVDSLGQKKEGDPPNPEAVQQMKRSVRQRITDVVERAISVLPKGLSESGLGILRRFASENDVHEFAPGHTAGKFKEVEIREDTKQLYKDIASENRSFMKESEMREAIGALGNMRGKDVPKYIDELRTRFDRLANSAHDDKFNPVIKQGRRWLDLAEQAYKEPKIREFLQKQYEAMDAARKYGNEKGFLTGGKEDFFHNIVAIKDHVDLWDEFLYGKKFDVSSFRDTKKYANGWETMLEGGVMPATMDSNTVLGHYWKSFGNASRKARFADILKEQAKLGEGGQILIAEDGKMQSAVVTKELIDKNPDLYKHYKQLDIINSQFRGVYAHPELHKWATSLFAGPQPSGFVESFMKFNGMWKGLTLAFGLYHAKSLLTKGAYLTASHKFGWQPFLKLLSTDGIGANALRSGSADHATLIKLIENGLSFHQHDGLYHAVNREYNIKTGDTTVKTKLLDYVDKATGWQHRMLFEKIHPRLKAGMAVQAVKSKWFENLVKEKNGDRDAAMRVLASTLNDTFGARNLEAAGRSPLAQKFMQAALLAPDWQESKIRRLFGSALYEDPTQRKMLAASLMMEAGAIVVLRSVAQGISNQWNGVERSMDEQAKDIWNGHFGSIWTGKSKNEKGQWVDNYINIFGSEQQDMRLVSTLFKAAWALKESGGAPAESLKVLADEYQTKASPVAKGFFDLIKQRYGEDKKEFRLTQPSTYMGQFTPIAIQQAIKATKEAKEGEGITEAGKALATGFIGTPMEKSTVKKEKKPEQKRKGKQIRLVG